MGRDCVGFGFDSVLELGGASGKMECFSELMVERARERRVLCVVV